LRRSHPGLVDQRRAPSAGERLRPVLVINHASAFYAGHRVVSPRSSPAHWEDIGGDRTCVRRCSCRRRLRRTSPRARGSIVHPYRRHPSLRSGRLKAPLFRIHVDKYDSAQPQTPMDLSSPRTLALTSRAFCAYEALAPAVRVNAVAPGVRDSRGLERYRGLLYKSDGRGARAQSVIALHRFPYSFVRVCVWRPADTPLDRPARARCRVRFVSWGLLRSFARCHPWQSCSRCVCGGRSSSERSL
jgi:hypothetical protein